MVQKLQKAKEKWEIQSKLKLKNWKEKKLLEIKEITIRGIEPEMNKVVKKSETEKEKIKQFYEKLLQEK